MNLVQFWDCWPDGSMTFHLLYTFEQKNKIIQQEIFEGHYHPVRRSIFLDKLAAMGYQDIQLMPYPAQDTHHATGEDAPWFCLIARKGQQA